MESSAAVSAEIVLRRKLFSEEVEYDGKDVPKSKREALE